MEYGLIPEFIGRLPVVAAIHQLTRDDLITILTEPRNALTKQFQRFFEFDDIELVFARGLARRDRRPGARARDRRPRPALDPRGDAARRPVRASLPPRRHASASSPRRRSSEGLKPTLVTEAAPDEPAELDELEEESA